MNSTTISIVIVGVLIGGVILFTRPSTSTDQAQNTVAVAAINNVAIEDTPAPVTSTSEKDVATTATTKTVTPEARPVTKPPVKAAPPVAPKQQIVEIMAKGGYTPKVSQAKANMPTILRMKTQSTYDCTSSINIPTLNIRKILPPDGVTDIPLPPQKLGTSLTVLCGMGMYNTVINFN